MDLKDLKETNLTLEDVKTDLLGGPTLGKRTASQQAATNALLSGSGVEGFREDVSKVIYPEGRKNFLAGQLQLREQIYADARKSLIDIIADPTISDEEKIRVTELAPQGPQNFSSLNTLAEQATLSDSNINETGEAEQFRYKMIDAIQESVSYKREMQSKVNAIRAQRNPSTVSTIVDIGELFVPFAEWIHYDRLQKDLLGDEYQVNFMGQQKQKIYDYIKSMPLEQRRELSGTILDILEDNEDVVLPDGNDLLLLETLQQMLVEDEYTNFERWFDNVTSVLDLTGLAAMAGVFKKGAKVAEGAGEARAADEALDGEILGPETSTTAPESAQIEKGEVIEGTAEDVSDRLVEEAGVDATVNDVDPASPSQIVKDHNPEQAREMHELAMESDEAAEALYGTNKTEAAANDLLPNPDDGVIKNKPPQRPVYPEPDRLRETRKAEGNTLLSESEWERVRQKLMATYSDVKGLFLHRNSLAIRTNDDGTFGIRARYSPSESGFATYRAMKEAAEYMFREMGLPPEAFKPIVKTPRGWEEVPVERAEAFDELKASGSDLPDVEFAIGVNYDYAFRPEDMDAVDLLETGRSLFSRMVQWTDRNPKQYLAKFGQGSLTQNLLDPHSVIPKQIVNAASVATDKAFAMQKFYTDLFTEFADDFNKLHKLLKISRKEANARKAKINDYIKEADMNEIPFSEADLYRRGFSQVEVDALRKFRRAADAMWYATNDDYVKSMRARGVVALVHKGNDTKLYGTPRQYSDLDGRMFYDPRTDEIVELTNAKAKELTDKGAEFLELSAPIEVKGVWIDKAVAVNTPEGGYTRKLYDGENVLGYRHGWYPRTYNANYFIDKKISVAGGKERWVTVASARDSGEVSQYMKDLQRSEGLTDPTFKETYRSRKDRRLEHRLDELDMDGSHYTLNTLSGLSSQRKRGKLLDDAGAHGNKKIDQLEDPLVSIAQQIRSLSHRTSMRHYLDSVKERWMRTYGDMLELPEQYPGGPKGFPTNISGVKGKHYANQKIIQQARTVYNYIYSLENGYINMLDETYVGLMQNFAHFMGELGVYGLERGAFNASKTSPTHMAKKLMFHLTLSSNPIRQAIIQRSQTMLLPIANPEYITSGSLHSDFWGVLRARYGIGNPDKKYKDLLKDIEKSGVLESVDAHTLIRQDMLRLTDATFMQKVGSIAETPFNKGKQVGFDAAEQDVLVTAYLAFRDKAVKEGKNLNSQRVKDEIIGDTRAFTLNMNRSGDIASSHNTLSLVAQFFAFQMKATLQPITNQALTAKQKAALALYTAALFGPGATLYGAVIWNMLPEDEPNEVKDAIRDGFLDMALNGVFSMITGEEQAIDFGDLAPTEAYGVLQALPALIEGGPGAIISQAPSVNMLFGQNPRAMDMFKTMAGYFWPGGSLDYQQENLSYRASDVIKSALNLTSGYSAAFKAAYAFETDKLISSSGRITDEEVTDLESLSKLGGFQTKDESGTREMYEVLYGRNKGRSKSPFSDEDVELWYGELKRHLARRGDSPDEVQYHNEVLKEAWRVFGQDRPRAAEIVVRLMAKDARAGDQTVINGMTNRIGIMSPDKFWKAVNKLKDGRVREELTKNAQTFERIINDESIWE